jgi:hypothetical protein
LLDVAGDSFNQPGLVPLSCALYRGGNDVAGHACVLQQSGLFSDTRDVMLERCSAHLDGPPTIPRRRGLGEILVGVS